jgi:hypothetical protein
LWRRWREQGVETLGRIKKPPFIQTVRVHDIPERGQQAIKKFLLIIHCDTYIPFAHDICDSGF